MLAELALVLFSVEMASALLMFEKGISLYVPTSTPFLVDSENACLQAMCEADSGCVPVGCSIDQNDRIGGHERRLEFLIGLQ